MKQLCKEKNRFYAQKNKIAADALNEEVEKN